MNVSPARAADADDRLQRLLDKDDIVACLYRYARGVDRADRALMRSAYHADGFDDHGVMRGTADAFVDWALDFHGRQQTRHQHIITNISIDLDGDRAHVESYYIFWGENVSGPPTLAFGRYVDRFERRAGLWAIAYRVCVNELAGTFNERPVSEDYARLLHASGPNTRGTDDVSYERPLRMGQTG
jgi:hypothetical protein